MRAKVVIAAACLAAAFTFARAATPVLTDVKVDGDGEAYVVSCRLESGLTPEILEEIDAGLETTIGYHLRVYRRRIGFLDETIARHHVRCTVHHDALTRQYTLTRRIDGEVQDTRVTGDPQAMRDFLTVLDRVPVARGADLVSGEQYYLKARSEVGMIWRFYLIPWPLDTEWVRVPIAMTEVKASDPKP